MKKTAFFAVALALVFAGCSTEEQPKSQPAAAATPAKTSSPTPQPAKPTSPERIAEIEASSQTGVWATVTTACPDEVKVGLRTTLVWNVKASGAERVILYVVDSSGNERNFGQGKSVGEKETGAWLHPGLVFRVRDYDTKDELGTVVIDEGDC